MRRVTRLLFFGAFILLFSVGQTIAFYTDWLWFQEVGYTGVFTTILGVKLLLALLSGGLFFLVLYLNLIFAARRPSRGVPFFNYENVLELPNPELIDPLVRQLRRGRQDPLHQLVRVPGHTRSSSRRPLNLGV